MSTPIVTQGLGIEELFDALEASLVDINDALHVVYNRREEKDRARAIMRGIPYDEIEFQEVPLSHIHTGNFPSDALENVPIEEYPYIVLMWDDYSADPEDVRNDQLNVYRDRISVHSLAMATDEEGSEVVWRRAVRMGEAVFLRFTSDPTVARMLGGLSNPVRGLPSVPWSGQEKGHGDNFWYQAIGTSYVVKQHVFPY